MEQKRIRQVANSLLTLEVAVRSITREDLKELLSIKDSGRHVGVEQLPDYVFKTPREGMKVLNALVMFKNSVSDIESYQER